PLRQRAVFGAQWQILSDALQPDDVSLDGLAPLAYSPKFRVGLRDALLPGAVVSGRDRSPSRLFAQFDYLRNRLIEPRLGAPGEKQGSAFRFQPVEHGLQARNAGPRLCKAEAERSAIGEQGLGVFVQAMVIEREHLFEHVPRHAAEKACDRALVDRRAVGGHERVPATPFAYERQRLTIAGEDIDADRDILGIV